MIILVHERLEIVHETPQLEDLGSQCSARIEQTPLGTHIARRYARLYSFAHNIIAVLFLSSNQYNQSKLCYIVLEANSLDRE